MITFKPIVMRQNINLYSQYARLTVLGEIKFKA